jgi:restriction endonuclease S subunit
MECPEKRSHELSWSKVRFDDVARNVKVKIDRKKCDLDRYVAGEHMQTDDLHIRKWGTIGEDYLGPAFNQRFTKGQILYGSRRTYLRKVAIADFDGICANTTFVIEPKSSELLPELVPLVMQSSAFAEHSIRMSKGSVNPYVNWKDIACFEFAIPPRPQQLIIAKILLSAENCLENYESLLGSLEMLKISLVRDLTSKGIGHKEFEATVMSRAPKDWRVVKLREVAAVRYGLGQPPERDENGVPMIRATNIKRGLIIGKDLLRVRRSSVPKSRNPFVRERDIIVVRSGAYAGDVGLVTGEWEDSIAGYDLIVTPTKDLDPIFLTSYLLSAKGQAYFSRIRSRSAQHHLNSEQVLETPIPLPPLPEQQYIARILSTTDATVGKTRKQISTTKALKMKLINELLIKGVGE